MLFLASLPNLVVGHTAGLVAMAHTLAHQGGWDEILMVLVPVSLFAVLLYVANRRATSMAARQDREDHGKPDALTSDGDPPVRTPREAPRNERGGPI